MEGAHLRGEAWLPQDDDMSHATCSSSRPTCAARPQRRLLSLVSHLTARHLIAVQPEQHARVHALSAASARASACLGWRARRGGGRAATWKARRWMSGSPPLRSCPARRALFLCRACSFPRHASSADLGANPAPLALAEGAAEGWDRGGMAGLPRPCVCWCVCASSAVSPPPTHRLRCACVCPPPPQTVSRWARAPRAA